ncbi:MAG: formyltetrahydrofolate deformylase [Tepidisphaeraceae bacterium]
MPTARKVLAVVGVVGHDQKGVVARFATYMAERGINIEDIEQRVVRGTFIMDMLVDIADVTVDLSTLITGLLDLGKSIGMDVRVSLHDEKKTRKLAILCSKEPHCLQHLLTMIAEKKMHAQVVGVLANHPDLEPVAKQFNVPFAWKSHDDLPAHFAWLRSELKKLAPDAIALARYMRVLPPEIVQEQRHKIVNIHPSLLPFFPGAAPYKQAYESGVRVSGCTAHFVTEQLDQGPVILQDVFHIDVGTDSLDDVKSKGLQLEAQTLGEAVRMFVDDELVVLDGNVVFKPGVRRFVATPEPKRN